jgi:hypothetical protein
MTRMRSPRSSALLSLLLLGIVAGAACRKASPLALGPSLTAPDTNRDRLLASLMVPSLDRTFATVDALHSQRALPFGSAELRSMLLARLAIPAEVLDLAHTGKPLGAALVAPARSEGNAQPAPLLAAACELRGAGAVNRVLSALGSPLASQKDARQFRRPDGGSFWLVQAGESIIWADTLEALGEAGAHALEARQSAGVVDDLQVTAYPAGYARLEGVDLSQGPAGLQKKLLEQYDQRYLREGRTPPPAERSTTEAVLAFLSGPMADSRQLILGLGLAEARGVGVRLQALPRPGSAFATQIATATPFTVDIPLAGDTPVSLLALGPSPTFLRLYQEILDSQARAGVTGAAGVAARARALAQHLSGAVTSVGRPSGGTLAFETAVGLKPGSSPTAAIEALSALATDPGLPALLGNVYRMQPPSVRVAREGDGLRVELAVPGDERPRTPAAFTRAMLGTTNPVLMVKPGRERLVLAFEPGAAARLQRLLVGGAGAPDPRAPLADALADSRGRDGVVYVDLLGYTRVLLGAFLRGGQARLGQGLLALPGLSQLSLPVWLHYRGGKTLEAELRIPRSTLTNASTAMGLFGGLPGAGLASPIELP